MNNRMWVRFLTDAVMQQNRTLSPTFLFQTIHKNFSINYQLSALTENVSSIEVVNGPNIFMVFTQQRVLTGSKALRIVAISCC